jgi:hypothetical protein
MAGFALFLGAAALVGFMTLRGWRLGVVRQVVSIVALALAYLAAWFGGHYLIPVLRPLGFPDRILTWIGSAVLALVVYGGISLMSAVVFKKTSQQTIAPVRWGFGGAGAILGAAFGLFLVFVSSVAIRLLGSLGEGEAVNQPKHALPRSGVASSLAHLKHSIETGPTGPIITRVDPVPEEVYNVINKLGQLASSKESLDRFAEMPKVQALSAHPKLISLRDDPEIQKALREQDFISLLRNPKLVEAVNDPEVAKLISGFDLPKALDAVLGSAPASQRHPPVE